MPYGAGPRLGFGYDPVGINSPMPATPGIKKREDALTKDIRKPLRPGYVPPPVDPNRERPRISATRNQNQSIAENEQGLRLAGSEGTGNDQILVPINREEENKKFWEHRMRLYRSGDIAPEDFWGDNPPSVGPVYMPPKQSDDNYGQQPGPYRYYGGDPYTGDTPQQDPSTFNIDAWSQAWQEAQQARGPANVLQESQYAPQNQLWAQELQRRAMGQGGPSPAELQMRAAQDAQARQALSLARSSRGVAPGMALRQAQQAQGQMAAQTAQQTSILRAQETQAAGQAYQQAIQAGMSQDMAMNQARLAQRQTQDAWQQFGAKGQQAEDRYNQLTQLQVEAMNRGDQREAARLAIDREKLGAQIKLAGQGRSDALLGGVLSTGAQIAIAALLSD